MTRELNQVVISGMGCITARGDFTLQNPLRPDNVSPPATNGNDAFTLSDFKLDTYLTSQKTYLDRCSALALAGCALALRDADLAWPLNDDTSTHHELCGITLGTHLGCIETMKGFWDKATERGTRLANPLLFSHSYFNTPISLCAIEFGLKGYHTTFCAGADSGLEAVRAAYDALRLGHAAIMLCGGVEAVTPARASLEPSGSEGEAGVFFVLESAVHATRRGVANTVTIDDGVLEVAFSTPAAGDAAQSLFGNCGGATSALVLAYSLAQDAEV